MAETKSLGLILTLFLWVGLVCAQENGNNSQSPVNLPPFNLSFHAIICPMTGTAGYTLVVRRKAGA